MSDKTQIDLDKAREALSQSDIAAIEAVLSGLNGLLREHGVEFELATQPAVMGGATVVQAMAFAKRGATRVPVQFAQR